MLTLPNSIFTFTNTYFLFVAFCFVMEKHVCVVQIALVAHCVSRCVQEPPNKRAEHWLARRPCPALSSAHITPQMCGDGRGEHDCFQVQHNNLQNTG